MAKFKKNKKTACCISCSCWNCFLHDKKKRKKSPWVTRGGSVFQWQLHTRLCRMRPLMGSRASYTVRASFTQSLGSMRNEETVRRMREPGTAVSFTWQFTPPQDEKTFRGTLAPGRLAYILSTHCEPARRDNKKTNQWKHNVTHSGDFTHLDQVFGPPAAFDV